MKIEKFDYYWRIALLVVLVFAIFWMGNEVRKVDMNGVECLKAGPCPISIYEQHEDAELMIENFNKALKNDESGG